MKKYIAVAGNIGVGKSTLVSMLCARLEYHPFFEPVTENPYLADFYADMRSWGFHSQVFFLTHRLQSHLDLARFPGSIIQDRSIYEDAEIFAHNLYLQGNIAERDYDTYRALYQTMVHFLTPPDLVIYLRASVPCLQERIARRSRSYESGISPDYLGQLNTLYEEWIASFKLCPVLTVPADDLDFVSRPEHLDLIVTKVQEKIMGKDEVIFSRDEVT